MMNNAETLTTLYGHNLWANTQLLELCAGLTDEQLDATIIGTFGSIRDTVQHIVTAERSYFARVSTGQPFRRAENEAPLSMSAVLELTRSTGAGFVEWATKVQGDETVAINWDGGIVKHIPKAIILTQVINHATEHRSQIMAILTQLGIQPPELDGWSYFLTQEN
jgi:uncharacterized damage-inducible protein DinB